MAVTKVVMPKLSEAMETGKLLRWLKQEGDRISGGDIVAEIETDKADIELEAFGSGILRKVLIAPGATVPVGSLIAIIADPADDLGALGAAAQPGPSAPAPVAPAAAPALPPLPPPAAAATRGSDGQAPAATAPAPFVAGGPRLKASPLAKKLAQQAGVDLAQVRGTGPGGRIIQRDIQAVAAQSRPAPAAAPGASPAASPAIARLAGESEDQPLSPLRAAIARQMVQSKGPVPHFYVTTEIAMERASALREEL